MRTRVVREVRDSWAVITHAVRVTCVYERRAQGLLCSVHQARRPHISKLHDPTRFSERATPLTDDHPLFSSPDHPGDDELVVQTEIEALVRSAVEQAIELVTLLSWRVDTARGGVEHV